MSKATPHTAAVKAATVTQLPRSRPLEDDDLPAHWAKLERSHYLWTTHYYPDRHAETYAYCEAMTEVGPREKGEKEIDYMRRRARVEMSFAAERYVREPKASKANVPRETSAWQLSQTTCALGSTCTRAPMRERRAASLVFLPQPIQRPLNSGISEVRGGLGSGLLGGAHGSIAAPHPTVLMEPQPRTGANYRASFTPQLEAFKSRCTSLLSPKVLTLLTKVSTVAGELASAVRKALTNLSGTSHLGKSQACIYRSGVYTIRNPAEGADLGMKRFRISQRVREKMLNKHGVTQAEVGECFLNRTGPSFRDPRERHDTDPPTWWFMSTTDRGRPLKVCYVEYEDFFAIKTSFEAQDGSDALYEQLCEQNLMKGA